MTKEEYDVGFEEFKKNNPVGTELTVIRKFTDDEDVTNAGWEKSMNEMIGKSYEISQYSGNGEIYIGNYWFPYFVLEPIHSTCDNHQIY